MFFNTLDFSVRKTDLTVTTVNISQTATALQTIASSGFASKYTFSVSAISLMLLDRTLSKFSIQFNIMKFKFHSAVLSLLVSFLFFHGLPLSLVVSYLSNYF